MKKVLIHTRQTVETRYALPNSQRFANWNICLPKCNSIRSRPGWVEPEVWFRVVHLAQDAQSGAPVAAYREQTVEIALGPKGVFENGNIGTLRRRAPPGQVLHAVPPGRGDPKQPRVPKTPRVVELLRKAIEWKALLESGQIASQADIACQEGITRARVTQILGLLRLAPEIQEKILSSPGTLHHRLVTERLLRPIGAIADHRDQMREFQKNMMSARYSVHSNAEGGTRTSTGLPTTSSIPPLSLEDAECYFYVIWRSKPKIEPAFMTG